MNAPRLTAVGTCACTHPVTAHSAQPGVGCAIHGCLCLSTARDVYGGDVIEVLHVLSSDDIQRIKDAAYEQGRLDELRRWTWGERWPATHG